MPHRSARDGFPWWREVRWSAGGGTSSPGQCVAYVAKYGSFLFTLSGTRCVC